MKSITSGHLLADSLDISDEALSEIGLILEMKRNFSISMYKDKYMKRRIAIRMRACRCKEAADYCNILRHSEQEIDHLKKNLTIHVSQFFRNPTMFEKLKTDVLPELYALSAAGNNQNLKICSLGCAGGEEAYSIAMLLKNNFSSELRHTPTEIHAIDIDTDILKVAAKAEYPNERLNELDPVLKAGFFTTEGGISRLVEQARSLVSFFQRDIIDVESYDQWQLVLCRNTLIYFTRPDQEKILRGIAQTLPSGGILVLGKSEALIGQVRTLFTTVCPVERIYRRL